eukprot:scaffold105343_cov49-Phaeocystis_antarctica.AAC.2
MSPCVMMRAPGRKRKPWKASSRTCSGVGRGEGGGGATVRGRVRIRGRVRVRGRGRVTRVRGGTSMSVEGSSLNSTCIDSSWRSAAFSSGVFEKTGGCHPAVSSTGADMTWLLRPLLKPRGSLREGRRSARVLGGERALPSKAGRAAQGGRVLLDEVVPHEAARRCVVKVVVVLHDLEGGAVVSLLHHRTPPPPRRAACVLR